MRGKQKRKAKQRKKRIEKIKRGKVIRFNLANSRVKYKGCKDIYGYQSNMHNLIYKDAKNPELGQGCICLKSYPKNEISCRLKDSIIRLAEYEKLYNYHVLHVNKNKLNMWNIGLLLQYGVSFFFIEVSKLSLKPFRLPSRLNLSI